MKRWVFRNLVCRFRGHIAGKMIPFFEPWYGGQCLGSLYCHRCGVFMCEVRYVKGVKA